MESVYIYLPLQNILPTRVNLARKCVQLDTRCVFCNNYEEDALQLWGPLQLEVRNNPSSNVHAWLLHVYDLLPNHKLELFFMLVWAIWVECNNVTWKGTSFCPVNTATWATKLLEDYHAAHPGSPKKKSRHKTQWQLPPRGRLKLNIDGAFHSATGQGGIGALIRNEDGVCLAAIARPFPHARSAFQMELEAMRAGLLLIIHQGLVNVDIETDCSLVIAALKSATEDYSEVGCIVEDCKAYLHAISSINLYSVYREANGVAHRLAHLASVDYLDDYWLDETPVIIRDALFEDSCTSTRGVGNMSPSLYNHHSYSINNIFGRGVEPPS
ncbi:uncharacterized protein LOC133737560 [Rosa rugosa]|uniref:uncharacterized protein LOC133737560 n=1 Tax=Rosa rugosa TaxID=74645 RepID=UPI002B418684|nr:uncharacterized protein LOC133737560 [Rosa rugosa]